MLKPALPFLLALGGAGLAVPAVAQQNDRTVIVYGNDPCPPGSICVRAKESDRYRIPQSLRSGALAPAAQPWAKRAASVQSAGAFSGAGSCSAAGPGGSTGCLQNQINDWRAERRQSSAAAADSALPR